jgi:hypothetical protein
MIFWTELVAFEGKPELVQTGTDYISF